HAFLDRISTPYQTDGREYAGGAVITCSLGVPRLLLWWWRWRSDPLPGLMSAAMYSSVLRYIRSP
ncbi:MAG: hypothetical protein WAR83_06080, partial [Flavobacteriales bacterium]